MKNSFKIGFLAIAVSISAACVGSKKSGTGDTTVKVDSTVKKDTTEKVDTAKKDTTKKDTTKKK